MWGARSRRVWPGSEWVLGVSRSDMSWICGGMEVLERGERGCRARDWEACEVGGLDGRSYSRLRGFDLCRVAKERLVAPAAKDSAVWVWVWVWVWTLVFSFGAFEGAHLG